MSPAGRRKSGRAGSTLKIGMNNHLQAILLSLKNGGVERRKTKERRQVEERRDGWLRIDKWRSISVFDE